MNTETGLNKILTDIGRTPDEFRRDDTMLVKILQDPKKIAERLQRELENESDTNSNNFNLERLRNCKNKS